MPSNKTRKSRRRVVGGYIYDKHKLVLASKTNHGLSKTNQSKLSKTRKTKYNTSLSRQTHK